MINSFKRLRNLKRRDIYFSRIIKAIWRRIYNIPQIVLFYLPFGFYKNNRLRLASFREIHKGKRCFIIANGPSLNKVDFNLLKCEITIGMNRIYLIKEQNGFMPNYIACIDKKSQILQFYNEMDKLEIPCFFNFDLRNKFSKKQNQYFIKGKFSPAFSKNPAHQLLGNGKSVTYAALQIAYFMGFGEIYLIGKDHSYNTNAKAGTGLISDGNEDNHFIKGYYKQGQNWDAPDYGSEEFAYTITRKEFERAGKTIKDATIGGKLNVFEKVDFFSLF